MADWEVDTTSEPGVLVLRLSGRFTEDEMRAFVDAHNRAIDGYAGRDYKVWVDIRTLETLSPDCASLFEQAKRYSSQHANFRGSSVLVSSGMVALQHRRTSTDGGVMDTELISDDLEALREHLRTVYRRASRSPRG